MILFRLLLICVSTHHVTVLVGVRALIFVCEPPSEHIQRWERWGGSGGRLTSVLSTRVRECGKGNLSYTAPLNSYNTKAVVGRTN